MKKYFFKIDDLSQTGAIIDRAWLQEKRQDTSEVAFCTSCLDLPIYNDSCLDIYLDVERGGKIPKDKPMYGVWGYGVGIISKAFVEAYPKLKDYLCFSNIYYGFETKELEPHYWAFVGKQTMQLDRVEKLPYLRPVYEENYQDYLKEPNCPLCGRPKQRPIEPQAKYRCLMELPHYEITTLDIIQSLLVTEEIAKEIKSLGIKKLSYTKVPYLGA